LPHEEAIVILQIGRNLDALEEIPVLIVNLDRPAFGLGGPPGMTGGFPGRSKAKLAICSCRTGKAP